MNIHHRNFLILAIIGITIMAITVSMIVGQVVFNPIIGENTFYDEDNIERYLDTGFPVDTVLIIYQYQSNLIIRQDYPYELWKRMFDEKGLIQVTFNDIDTYFLTIRSYEIYAEECYNDSIIKDYHINLSGIIYTVSRIHQDDLKYAVGIDTTWTHPKPTFKGFIEWLEED